MNKQRTKVLLSQCHEDIKIALEALRTISYACTDREDLFARQIKKLADEALEDIEYEREEL